MARRSTSKIDRVKATMRLPAVSVDDLALMLEIDLVFGRKKDFRSRLQCAIDDAFRQGLQRS